MSTVFPNQIDQFQVHADNANETIAAAAINNIQDSIVAIQQAIGTQNSGMNAKITMNQAMTQTMMVMGGF